MRVRRLVRVEGIVQGVGFRPFVYAVAGDLGLTGHVGNDARGVFIEAEGEPAAVNALVQALHHRPPPLAVVELVTTTSIRPRGTATFTIVGSDGAGSPTALVAADVATCADCLAELFDPADRRYRYPFVNCTNCGPRFTIVTDVPYDRAATTMAGFPMCAACAQEYLDPADRRFHAQPVCCPACGPRLRLLAADGRPRPDPDPLAAAVAALSAGQVLAVKGLGGYHLAADAGCQPAVAALRARKHREDKPFAVMCPDLSTAARLAHVDDAAARLLTGPQRPIVLLPRRCDGSGAGAELAGAVAPRNRNVGLLLPYTPLHHLLAAELRRPFVLTSGNVSDEPIAYRDDDALDRLTGIADGFLVHDRPIHVRTDDSVLRCVRGRALPVRRSRGYTPAPLPLPVAAARPLLGCGAELKSTFALARGPHAFLSHHIGDLENLQTLQAYRAGVEHFGRLFAIRPRLVVHDLHPEYLSTKYAMELPGVDLLGVQHHHAHVAACLADNGETGPVLGVAFDGLGYGPDGTLWGGELLVADLVGFRRVGHLEPVHLPGGVTAIRQPWRTAVSWLQAGYGRTPPGSLGLLRRHADAWPAVARLAAGTGSGIGAPTTTSVGRLFDAVAALCGVRDVINYEGQAAVELEQLADPTVTDGYPVAPVDGAPLQLPGADLIRAVVEDLLAGTPAPVVAARFHHGLAAVTTRACDQLRADTGLQTVALSGGVFQNELLLGALTGRLEQAGFRVLTHHRVPPNDGGISLGQVAVGAAVCAGDNGG